MNDNIQPTRSAFLRIKFCRVACLVACVTAIGIVGASIAKAQDRKPQPDSAITTHVDFQGEANAPDEPLSLWYRQPAKIWTEALAIGNGRLGAMIFGGVDHERIQLNENTLWGGGPYDPSNPDAKEAQPEVRRLIFAGKFLEAQKLIGEKMMARPLREMPYETVGDLLLTFPGIEKVTDYRRSLNLESAVSKVEFTSDGTNFTREIFASPVDQVIVMRFTADKPGSISFTAGMRTPQKATVQTRTPSGLMSGPSGLVMSGVNAAAQGIAGLKFRAEVHIQHKGGEVAATDDSITVSKADSATLLIAIATSYKNYQDVSGDPDALVLDYITKTRTKAYDKLLADHVAEHQRLFHRVSLDLGGVDKPATKLPTEQRIHNFAEGNDPQFAALYFQFGRYLLICSSRPGGQPANLQGLWNESMNPPWESKYTININTEMNYWPAEQCNLADCVEPLIAMVMDLAQTGARTAQVNYGARGWVAHHNTDIWRASGPVDGPANGMWPSGGAWLCLHLWDHYRFSGDKEYLAKIYPAMKGAATFFLDDLVEDPNTHYLVTCPSMSPEHGHGQETFDPGAEKPAKKPNTSICAGPTMDMQIIRDLFTNCITAAEILGVDPEFRDEVAKTRERLAPNKIGSVGQLQEWQNDWDMIAGDLHHRHVSHLYGLYPSQQINLRDTPDVAAAAKKSLEIRGDDATGWGLGWRLNLWDRLHDGDHAYTILCNLLSSRRTYPNMFDTHPPFQIDGNFGGAAGIAEMLLQSDDNMASGKGSNIDLLPSLPKAWPTGNVKGLRARGGFDVDLSWDEGKLKQATIHSNLGRPLTIHCGDKNVDLKLDQGQKVVLDSELSHQ